MILPGLIRERKEEKHLNCYTEELLDKKVSPSNSLNAYYMSSVYQIKSGQMNFRGEIKRKALGFSVGLVIHVSTEACKNFSEHQGH